MHKIERGCLWQHLGREGEDRVGEERVGLEAHPFIGHEDTAWGAEVGVIVIITGSTWRLRPVCLALA